MNNMHYPSKAKAIIRNPILAHSKIELNRKILKRDRELKLFIINNLHSEFLKVMGQIETEQKNILLDIQKAI